MGQPKKNLYVMVNRDIIAGCIDKLSTLAMCYYGTGEFDRDHADVKKMVAAARFELRIKAERYRGGE